MLRLRIFFSINIASVADSEDKNIIVHDGENYPVITNSQFFQPGKFTFENWK